MRKGPISWKDHTPHVSRWIHTIHNTLARSTLRTYWSITACTGARAKFRIKISIENYVQVHYAIFIFSNKIFFFIKKRKKKNKSNEPIFRSPTTLNNRQQARPNPKCSGYIISEVFTWFSYFIVANCIFWISWDLVA